MNGSCWSAVGALAVAVVTLAVWGLNYKVESWRRGDAARNAAYVSFVASVIRTADRMGTTLSTLGQRSGLNEGLAVVLRWRKPMTAMDLFEWLAKDIGEMWQAWVQVQVSGSRRGIDRATRAMNIMAEFGDVLAHAGPQGPGGRLAASVVAIDVADAQRAFGVLREQMFGELRALIALAPDESKHNPIAWLRHRRSRPASGPAELQQLTG